VTHPISDKARPHGVEEPTRDPIPVGGPPGKPSSASRSDPSRDKQASGPDPAIGAGITLFGIFLMGTGGAADAHYVFDAGVATGMIGAATFVAQVALSALKQRRAAQHDPPA